MSDHTLEAGGIEGDGDAPATRTEVRWALWTHLPLLIALVALWMLLWGSISWLNLVTGAILAVLVTRVFFLPAVDLSGRLHLGWFLVFLGRFSFSLVIASFQVALQAFSPKGVRHNGVIAVQLDTRSDFIMTMTAIALSLIPGSIVLEVDRQSSILYLHVLGASDEAALDKARADVLAVERRLVRAIGSKDDVQRIAS